MRKYFIFLTLLFIFMCPSFVFAIDVSFGELVAKPYEEKDMLMVSKGIEIPDGYITIGGDLGLRAFILKTDKTGTILWKNTSKMFFMYKDVVRGNDGNYVVAAACSDASHACLLKFNDKGELLWNQMYGTVSRGDAFKSILNDTDGYIVTGIVYNENIPADKAKGGTDGIIAKYDEDGTLLWEQIYGGSGNDNFNTILKTKDGGYLVSGTTNSMDISGLNFSNQTYKRILVKYDSKFNIVWQKEFNDNKSDEILKIVEDDDGNIIMIAAKNPNSSSKDAVIYKMTSTGSIIWSKVVSGTGAEVFSDVVVDGDNYVVLLTTTSEDIFGCSNSTGTFTGVLVYNKDGDQEAKKCYKNEGYDQFSSIIKLNPNYYYVFGMRANYVDGSLDSVHLSSIPVSIEMSFNVYQNETMHGSYDVEQTNGKLIVTPKPDDGYVVDRVFVYNSNVYFPYTKNGNEYHFNIDRDVNITVSFKKKNTDNVGNVFYNAWSIKNDTIRIQDDMLYEVYSGMTRYKNGIIAYENVNMEDAVSGKLKVYDNLGKLVKEKQIDDYYIINMIEVGEHLYAVALASNGLGTLLKFDSNLELIDDTTLPSDFEIFEFVYGNLYNIEVLLYEQNNIYIVNEDNLFIYDTSLKLVNTITEPNDEVCSIAVAFCLLNSKVGDSDEHIYIYDELNNKKVIGSQVYGSDEIQCILQLYDGDKLLFEKKFDDEYYVMSATLFDNYIVVVVENNNLEILILDYSGNVVQIINDNLVYFNLLKFDSGFVVKGVKYAPENNEVCEYYEECYVSSIYFYDLYPSITVTGDNSDKIEISSNAKPGETVTVKVGSKLGYTFEGLKITDANGNVTIVEGKSFVMPATAIQIEPIFTALINPETGTFISILFVLLIVFVSGSIYRYGTKKQPILKI